MSQPVRQTIQAMHPELAAKPFYTLIIDGNNLLRQSMADEKVNVDGLHYGGIFQFLLQIRMMLTSDYKYDYVYVVFDDTDSGILRYQIYNEYKANRDKAPEDLHAQVPMIRTTLEKMGVPVVSREGYEADDMIASLAAMAGRQGIHTVMVTADKDLMQLVSPMVSALRPPWPEPTQREKTEVRDA